MIERLKILQANRSRFSNGREAATCLLSDKALRQEVEILSKAFFNTSVSGCGDCYAEAYTKLMNLNIKEAMAKIECPFVLGAGRLLQDINDRTKTCSQANITLELALYHLAKNPNEIKKFVKFPEDWEKQVENFKNAKPAENIEDSPEQLEAEKNIVSQIKVLLKNGTSKKQIKETFKSVEKVGEKDLTGKMVASFLEIACSELEAEKNTGGEDPKDEILNDQTNGNGSEDKTQDSKPAEFSEAEEAMITEIQNLLVSGTSKTDIKAKYSQVEMVGDKKLTGVLLDAFLKEAAGRTE